MPATMLNQVQRDWLSKRITGSTVSAQTPVGQLKRMYYTQYLGANQPGASLIQLEISWLQKYLATKGVSTSARKSRELWTLAALTTGRPASHYVNDNMITFYINAAA